MADIGRLSGWLSNGASSTISEFTKLSLEDRKDVLDYIGDFEAYAKLEVNGQKYLLVHAGLNDFSDEKAMEAYSIDDLVWTRADYEIPYYEDKIVITGHTPTQYIIGNPKPGYIYKANHHIAIDCGASFEKGRLAGMCLETGEEFYSRD